MGKILVISEKPSVARDCAEVLGCTEKHKGYIEGEKYIISWALGHLITLKDPDEYNKDWKVWDINKLPMTPTKFETKVTERGREQFNVLKTLINRSDVTSLINAGDAGREGELIQRYIYEMAGNKKPVQRLWISSQTKSAIEEGFENLRKSSEFDLLYESALARAQIDWLYGLNYTRAFTKKYGNGKVLSTGRCQTPILRLVVDRDKEIDDFVPTDYFEVYANFKDYIGKYIDKDNNSRIKAKEKAIEIENRIKGKIGTVVSISEEKKSVQAPLLYNLNSLQQKMNSKYGFAAQKTLDVLQRLYEVHKIATYPRASAQVISTSIFEQLKSNINNISFGEFKKFIPELKIKNSKRYVDDGKIEDHHAIIPDFRNEDMGRIYGTLNNEERTLFDELAKSILATFLPNYEYSSTILTTNVEGYDFVTKGKQELQLGWRTLYMDEPDLEKVDSIGAKVSKGDRTQVIGVDTPSKKTAPKPRYTEAKLLKEMAKYGIGTQATMAGLIETLKTRGYVSMNKKALISTALGKEFIGIIPIEDIKSVEMTSDLESSLEKISKGIIDRMSLIHEVSNTLRTNIDKIKEIGGSISSLESTDSLGFCPCCKKGYVVKNKFGYGCSEWKNGCKFTISKKIAGKELTESQIKVLVKTGTTSVIEGFISKAGKTFDTKLKINISTSKVEFDFDSSEGESVKCPTCGSPMVNSSKVCKCDKCNILIFKEVAQKELSDKFIKQLLEKGITDEIKAFKSKSGKSFDARLKLVNGKVEFVFN